MSETDTQNEAQRIANADTKASGYKLAMYKCVDVTGSFQQKACQSFSSEAAAWFW